MKSTIEWNGKMKFKATGESGHEVFMDASEKNGGEDSAGRPKEMVLHGLGGCSGMDVVSILRKMRQEPASFRMEVNAEQTDEHPIVFNKIHLKYIFTGELEHDKVSRAVELSQTKFCGVSEMLKKSAVLTYEIIYE